MDPNFFRVDLERVLELFVALVLVAMFLERALALLFEHDWFIAKFRREEGEANHRIRGCLLRVLVLEVRRRQCCGLARDDLCTGVPDHGGGNRGGLEGVAQALP